MLKMIIISLCFKLISLPAGNIAIIRAWRVASTALILVFSFEWYEPGYILSVYTQFSDIAPFHDKFCLTLEHTLREESSQTNVILRVQITGSNFECSLQWNSTIIQYILHFYYTLYDGKYDCEITMHQTIFQLQCFVLLNNHQYNCNIRKSFLSAYI